MSIVQFSEHHDAHVLGQRLVAHRFDVPQYQGEMIGAAVGGVAIAIECRQIDAEVAQRAGAHQRVDALMRAGTLRYLCINLSTLDRDRYTADRGADHLALVLRNVESMRDKALAEDMRIVVLGELDDRHRADYDAIAQRFAGSRFTVMMHHATDRAGWLDLGLKRPEKVRNLAGCDLMGSRPLQHLHITPSGKC